MKTIREYIEKLFKDIPNSNDKVSMMEDIISNLEEKVLDLMNEGKEEEDAINKTIVEFGDVSEIKDEFSDSYKYKNDKRKKYRNYFAFSVGGTILIAAMLVFANYYYTPQIIWYVIPTIGVMWWPLTMLYKWLTSRDKS